MDLTFDFEALMHLEGAAFTLKREQWLTNPAAAREEVKRHLRTRAWRARATAVIIAAYLDAGPLCASILERFATRDVETFPNGHVLSQLDYFRLYHEGQLQSATAAPCAAALGYEALLKRRGEWPLEWRDLLFAAIPHDEAGADALLFGLSRSDDPKERERIARVLMSFPRPMITRKWRAENARFDDTDAALEEELGITVLPKRRQPATEPGHQR